MNLTVGSAGEKEVGGIVVLRDQRLICKGLAVGEAHIAEGKLEVLKKKTYGSVGTFNDRQHRMYLSRTPDAYSIDRLPMLESQ